MKKTPIIAGVVGLGILGGAYLGGLYISGNKAMSALQNLVDESNQSAGFDLLSLQEEKGLFSSAANLSLTNPTRSVVLANAQLTLHHGVFSTDIDGKFMLNDPRWQQIEPIRKNGGLDVQGHFNSFGTKGSFAQIGMSGRVDDAKPSSDDNTFSFFLRAEPTGGFDPATQDKLRELIAKGMNGQVPTEAAPHDISKESHGLISVRARGPKSRVDIEMPVLYQNNGTFTDSSALLTVRLNGEDVLKPYGIQSINGVSHTTDDKYHRGSYTRIDVPGKIMLPSAPGATAPSLASDVSFLAEVNDKQASASLNIGGMDFQDDSRHFSVGPMRFTLFNDIDTYGRLMMLEKSLGTLSPEGRQAAVATLETYLPNFHFEMNDMVIKETDYDDADTESTLKSVTMDIVRDLSAPVTHFTLTASDVNSSDVQHAELTQRITVDQSIVDTGMRVLQELNQARFQPSDALMTDAKQQVLALLQRSPRIVLDELYFSAENLPRPLRASGEVSVLGDALKQLEELDEKRIKAHFTINGLPDELVSEAHSRGMNTISADKPVEVDFLAGNLLINGQRVQ